MQRPSFLDQKAPAGYIAGVGRGATGFSTRGDQSGRARTPKRFQSGKNGPDITENGSHDTLEVLSKDELESEQVFAAIETKLSTRRKAAHSTNGNVNSQIPGQFADLKRSLATVSEEEWLNLPDAGDLTRKNKRERLQDQLNRKNYAAPDTLLNQGVNFAKLTEERERLLGRQLDKSLIEGPNSDKLAAGKDVVNYLEELETSTSKNLNGPDQAEDIKRMRAILLAYRKADPMRAEGWIASARLEERACKFQRAKSVMEEACATCPRNDEIWLERIRLNASDVVLCRALVAEGIQFNPKSLPLWMKAVDLETEMITKKRVVMKALHELPKCEKLWKQVITFETGQSERQMILRKAVELVPESVDLWKALVELQNYANARKSLNTARKILPKNHEIIILAAQVEERFNENVTKEVLEKQLIDGMDQLENSDNNPDLEVWLNCAQSLDAEGKSPKVTEAIVTAALSKEQSRSNTIHITKVVDNMKNSLIKIIAYRVLLNAIPTDHKIWRSLRSTCLSVGKPELLYEVYEHILFDQVNDCQALKQNPILALIYAKELWKYGNNVHKTLDVLENSIKAIPTYLDFWIAKLKVLCFSSMFEEAQKTFLRSIKFLATSDVPYLERLYLKYVSFLRFDHRYQEAIDFLEQACLVKFPECYKFYLQRGQIYHDMGQLKQAREAYALATKRLPQCSTLWTLLAKMDEIEFKNSPKARSELDIALLKNPQDEALYLAKIRMECREGFHDQARLLVLQALQKFPNSPEIWSENIKLQSSRKPSAKKTIFQDALRHTKNSSQVLNEIGLSFFRDGQYPTALKWFERAKQGNPKFGDAWVWLARCSLKMKKDLSPIYKEVEEHEPIYGPLWISITKDMRYQYKKPSEVLRLLLKNA